MKISRKIISLILSLLLVFGAVSIGGNAFDASKQEISALPFASISDIHLYPESLMGSRGEEWLKSCRLESKCFNESEAVLIHALDNVAARKDETGIKYILLPGDLTKDSEYEAHVRLAEILREYSEKYGFQFLVTTGNHDINNKDACTFENDKEEPARAITAAEFPVVYGDFGFDGAIDRFAYPENGDEVQGGLSYIYDLGDDYRLISVDSSIYGFTDVPQKQVTGGTVTDELNDWIRYWAEKSYEDGKIPFVMCHHSMAPHMEVEPSITFAFVLDDYLQVAEKWASWGIHYVYTGHLHTNDISSDINDDGNVLYDIETNSLTGFPNAYRENVLTTYADGHTSLYSDAIDFDSEIPFTFDGVTYEKGTYKNKSFNLCFGGGVAEDGKANITDFLVGVVKAYLGDWIVDIGKEGGIIPFLKTMDIDVEKIISDFLAPYLGGAVSSILSSESIMCFVNDLDEQICEKYVNDPDYLYSVIEHLVSELAGIEVADIPCTRFIDSIGFGDPDRNGTLNDLVLTAMYYWYTGNEDAENDAFFMNAVEKLESGESCEKIFNIALDLIVNDLLQDEILANVDIRLEKLLSDSRITAEARKQIRNIGKKLLKNDLSYKHLIDVFFSLEILPYKNLLDALDGMLISEYLTDSQFEGTGTYIAYVLKDFATDSDPKYAGDYDVTYTSEKVEVPATVENYRLPADIAITTGDDSASQANISFYSKYTLDGDIEIYEAESEPAFTGEANSGSAPFGVDVETEEATLSYTGIDLGVIGFFNYEFPVNRTVIRLSNLKPGTKYFFRVGNEKYGWWSEACSLETADGGNEVTFIHTADPQSQTVNQYTRSWAKVLETAYELYPDTDFSVNTGDLVDHGDNSKQWSMMFETAGRTLRNTYLMPASGNHEGKGTNATANFFTLPNQPDQDTTSGVYYSYDWNNAHIAVLNTNDLGSDNALSGRQTDWLIRDMESSDAEWKFVVLHKAIYSNGSHFDDKDVKALRSQLSTLMPALGIDMVFQGHDHVYLRTGVMDSNKVVATEKQYLTKDGAYYKSFIQPKGTIYAISGTAGVKTYLVKDATQTDKLFPRAEKLLAVDHPMFSAVEIKDKVLYFTAYTVTDDGEANPIDRIAIQKDLSQGEVAEDYEEAEEEAESESCLATMKSIFDIIMKILIVLLNIFRVFFMEG